MNKGKVLFGFLGVTLDNSKGGEKRWNRWRPTVSLVGHDDFPVKRIELLYQAEFTAMAYSVVRDMKKLSPDTEVVMHEISLADPWNFEEVYSLMYDFAHRYDFSEQEDYYVHITTGTHVVQICSYLLTESRHYPAKLLQSHPSKDGPMGKLTAIDLDLSQYDHIANRFRAEQESSQSLLKSGIATRDVKFNKLIEQIELVSRRSDLPILLSGPTGAGKSQLARRVFELKKSAGSIEASMVEVNCATLRGQMAMSALFGHVKGAFTGAASERKGLLKEADGGLLFLDEVAELGLDEQAMLLRALELKTFLPVGSDTEQKSSFQLICGSNEDLQKACKEGRFRRDLLARMNTWHFHLPGLKDRREDIEPNLDYELQNFSAKTGDLIRFNAQAREKFLRFAQDGNSLWQGNFRDLNAAVHRMATLAGKDRIDEFLVEEEATRLRASWSTEQAENALVEQYLSEDRLAQLDPFDTPQLQNVLEVCLASKSLSEAGRKLFSYSRTQRKVANDADRLRKYLAKFDLAWADFS